MNFSSVKKFLGIRRKKKTVELKKPLIKDLEVFRQVPTSVDGKIEDVKLTLTDLLRLWDPKSSDYKLFNDKLISFVKYLNQNLLLREYVKHIYSKYQQHDFKLIVEELSQTCVELSSHMNNMLYFNNRNSRIAKMVMDIDETLKQLKEKRKKICTDVELAINQRMAHKWSVLITSMDKQLLETFLSEISSRKKAIELRQKSAEELLAKMIRTRYDQQQHPPPPPPTPSSFNEGDNSCTDYADDDGEDDSWDVVGVAGSPHCPTPPSLTPSRPIFVRRGMLAKRRSHSPW